MITNSAFPLPYYAVIFTSVQNENIDGYEEMANKMLELARQQPGFLGFESAHEEIGVSVSYWESTEAIASWKRNTDHILAQQAGRQLWYASYKIRICRVEREYEFIASN